MDLLGNPGKVYKEILESEPSLKGRIDHKGLDEMIARMEEPVEEVEIPVEFPSGMYFFSNLKWTKEKPTEAGYYWFRKGPEYEVVMVQLKFKDRTPIGFLSMGHHGWIPYDHPATDRGEYAGPIPAP